jgi:hypothetical protein
MLQQGLPVADVCCYYGDQVPNFIPPDRGYWYELCPSLGDDYACDFADMETLLTRMQVRGGRLVLPDRMSYRLLVFPDDIAKGFPCHGQFIQPELLQKLLDLVSAGATIVWPRPSLAPGLRDHGRADGEIKSMADKLWGPVDGKSILEHRFGKGRVVRGKTVRQVLLDENVLPDFTCQPRAEPIEKRLAYIHRRVGETELYFVSNRDGRRWVDSGCFFRVHGKSPELWHPDTGEVKEQFAFEEVNGRTWLPLRLPPAGSIFVVFRHRSNAGRIVSASKDGRALFSAQTPAEVDLASLEVESAGQATLAAVASSPGEYVLTNARGRVLSARVEKLPGPVALPGPWKLRFLRGPGAPQEVVLKKLLPWTEHDNPAVRYFSGTAAYETEFSLSQDFFGERVRVYLHLGVVKELAEIRVNGRDCGLLWKIPFRADVTNAVRPGKNQLEIKVTNLWPNRLIGDTFLPEGKQFTRTNIAAFTQNSPLLESGLLGPVELHAAQLISLR